ncbi:MAG: 4-hydroxy-3-methylbut-2-enyl diphosphate reductase [Bacteroidales bacterium]|nr:4-hydroxy-3-methylbut-2-enyl diphosphate reductase [Candidatus Cacconaster merdequi]
MRLDVEIDPRSGFCNGVVRAINQAEHYLENNSHLYSLGAIVHNSVELERLKEKGLEILSVNQLEALKDDVILIRAHGEPPATYSLLQRNNIQVIDCTCPVVLKLQEKVRTVYERMCPLGGQILIFGKQGHAEVNGLVGQTGGAAIVIDSVESASNVDFNRPVALFSQTTKDPVEYAAVAEYVRSRRPDAEIYDTICRQVAQRHKYLVDFASSHSMIIFVSGRESSNGKVLFELCKSVNERTFWVENTDDINPGWMHDGDRIGICGATSTPKWQLEEIFVYLRGLSENQ